jgi:hypothetical protein
MGRMKQHPQAKETALRYVEKLRADLKGQPASDVYLAEQAARYVGAKSGDVLAWMRGR